MHWLTNIWFGYFWPSIKSNGPEALVQTVVYGGVAAVVYPPFRHWITGHFQSLHAKVDHIIKYHPDIPEFNGADSKPAESPTKPDQTSPGSS